MHVLTISLGRNILREGRERERMQGYAKHLTTFSIIVLTRKEHGFSAEVHEGNMHLYPTNSSNRLMMLVDAQRIARRIARENKDVPMVISAQDPLEIGWLSLHIAHHTNMRFHVQVHGDYFSSEAWVGRSPLRRMKRFFALILLRRAPSIRVVSERIKKSLVTRGVSSEKITVLPIRPELEHFLATPYDVRTEPPYTFLFIGRLAPEKDIQRILRAFARVYTQHPTARLRIVGEGSEQKNLMSLVVSLKITDAVVFLPWTENVPHEMAEADAFLLASKHEAYALTLIEAMAVGLPLITTDVGCVGEVVQNGVQGIVVDDSGDSAYADAMMRMLEDNILRATYSKNGKETARAIAGHSSLEYEKAWVTAIEQVS